MDSPTPDRIVPAAVTLLVFAAVMWTVTQTDVPAFFVSMAPSLHERAQPGLVRAQAPIPTAGASAPPKTNEPSEDDPFAQAKKLAETPTELPDDQSPAALQRHGPALVVDPRKAEQQAERDRKLHQAVQEQLAKTAMVGARGGVEITMYSTSWCGACKSARAYMQAKQIPFTDYDVERDSEASARAHALNPRGSVPTITIDQEVMIGFGEQSLEDRIARAAKRRAGEREAP